MDDRTPKYVAHDVTPALVPQAAIDWMTSHVFIARELTGPEFAPVVGHDLPLIGAFDLMEALDRAPKYVPVTAPWKE